jgi:hypothetical protein
VKGVRGEDWKMPESKGAGMRLSTSRTKNSAQAAMEFCNFSQGNIFSPLKFQFPTFKKMSN